MNGWENRYLEGRTGWDRGSASPNLDYWIEKKILKPCSILIPGCGNGYEALALAEHGFDVTAIDIAPTPIKNLKNALLAKQLSAEVILADFFTWQSEKPFNAIYEQTSLCALSPEKWHDYEKCLYDWLKPGGKLFAQFMQTDQEGGPPFHCEISNMMHLFTSQRWQWSKQHETQIVHSNGKYEKIFILEKVCSKA